MKLLSPAISRLARLRLSRIEHWVSNPHEVQHEVFKDLITAAQYTEIGRKYDFKNLFTLDAFKAAVPIHEYEDLKPYIERIMQGEQYLLWNTPIKWLLTS